MISCDAMKKSSELGQILEWDKFTPEIPFIPFKPGWLVKITPPFSGAMIRFRVKKGENETSVYLDCHDVLAWCREPYWEVYPYQNDVGRCGIKEVDKLLEMISDSLGEGNEANQ
jgi:hypothetical protein